ncbi:MAG: FAD-dependent oxidoreductase [Nitrososphaerales archaeon]|jgi:glycine/D-amino acid oxidase-like deaminating enzyme
MRTEVAVVGGGSTGASVLYHLARSGSESPLLIERGPSVASGQTSRSTALVRTHYTVPVVARMALLSYRFFRDFESMLPGYSAGYRETGLLIGVDRDSEGRVRESLRTFAEMGIDSSFVDRDALGRIEPLLDAGQFSSVVYEPHMGYAEPSATAGSFAGAAERLGARVVTGAALLKVERASGGRYPYSLTTTAGVVEAGSVVLATGVWSAPLLEPLGIALPIKPVRHPVAVFVRPEGFRGLRPAVFDFVRSAYYKAEGQSLLFVGSMEAELDASSAPADPDRYDEGVTFEEVEKYSLWTSQAFPIMGARGRYESGYSGLYDNTPDQQPIIDELSEHGYPGLHCLVGLSGHGFKLCPEFGRVMASLVLTGGFDDYDVSVFGLKRFETGDLLRSGYGVSTVG